MRFENQVVVITGAAQGIGFSTAQRLASEGAQIFVLDVNGDGAERAAAELRETGAKASAYGVDVSDKAGVNDVMAKIENQMGAIHALISNAAISVPWTPLATLGIEDLRRMIAVNLEGTLFGYQAVYPIMKRQKYGRIINFSSGSFYEGVENMGAYIASKAGIIGLTRVMATEAGPDGITVNAISPGIMATEGAKAMPEPDKFFSWILTVQHVKRTGQASDIAEAIAYLASPGASFVTGQTISVDGGVCYR